MNLIRIKRIYDPAMADDGYRVLVDRLWPEESVKKRRASMNGQNQLLQVPRSEKNFSTTQS